MRDRLKSIREAAASLAEPTAGKEQNAPAKPVPGLVASLRAARTPATAAATKAPVSP